MSDEQRALSDAQTAVKTQAGVMRRCLDSDILMDALKAASTMLAELRTSALSPKHYYELYVAVCDALRYLSSYLFDAHSSGKHHLADLYELVQYAGNIVPRLYLMITVGTTYMSIPGAPIREVMKDMMEMSRGVQHPTRGLFLRHYLSGMTRDHLPVDVGDAPSGSLQDSIGFVLTNLIEMNKLWVRLQHQGLTREREKRELERKDLRILVGTNLVRLSQLEGVNLEMYRTIILPSILEQVVNCKDVIAQEYLMEVITQVFTDDLHIRTLGPFLSATAQLHPKVNIKQIVISLIDRLAAFAAREAEAGDDAVEDYSFSPTNAAETSPESSKIAESPTQPQQATTNDTDESEKALIPKDQRTFPSAASPIPQTNGEATISATEKQPDDGEKTKIEEKSLPKINKYRGIPEDVKLFEVFWHQIVELVKARPDLGIQDITALLVSITNLSLSCYPERLSYIGQILSFALAKIQDYQGSPDLHHPQTTQNLLALLTAPISSYTTVLTLLKLPHYQELLYAQPYATRRGIAHAIVNNVLRNQTIISTPEDVKSVLEMCHVLVKDQRDSTYAISNGRPGPNSRTSSSGMNSRMPSQQYDADDMAEEQGWMARMVRLFKSDDLEVQFSLLQTAREEFNNGGERIIYTYPPLVTSLIRLARDYTLRQSTMPDYSQKIDTLFRFIHRTTASLYNRVESSEICLRLYLLALQVADSANVESLAYEFAVQAFTIYEESINESKAQLQAVTVIVSTLQQTRVFNPDNYDTLITKAALHGAKLLKKAHQASAVALASHLWWQTDVSGQAADQRPPYQNGAKVLSYLQRAQRIAETCIDELVTVQLHVEILERYLYFLDRRVTEIQPASVNELVDRISSTIDQAQSAEGQPVGATSGLLEISTTPEGVSRHFQSVLSFILSRKNSAETDGTMNQQAWAEVSITGACLKYGIGN